ncbi:hypothetical protein BTE77_34875 [Ensifer adhaerens]|nr:hypothetical protein BTE77_34875 [Ensifer adhaerens]
MTGPEKVTDGPTRADPNRASLEAHLERKIEDRLQGGAPEEIERKKAAMREMLSDIEERTGRLPNVSLVDDKDVSQPSVTTDAMKSAQQARGREHNKDRDVQR